MLNPDRLFDLALAREAEGTIRVQYLTMSYDHIDREGSHEET